MGTLPMVIIDLGHGGSYQLPANVAAAGCKLEE